MFTKYTKYTIYKHLSLLKWSKPDFDRFFLSTPCNITRLAKTTKKTTGLKAWVATQANTLYIFPGSYDPLPLVLS